MQDALDDALRDCMKPMLGVLFTGMFLGQKDKSAALAAFKRGAEGYIEAHTEASKVIAELLPGQTP